MKLCITRSVGSLLLSRSVFGPITRSSFLPCLVPAFVFYSRSCSLSCFISALISCLESLLLLCFIPVFVSRLSVSYFGSFSWPCPIPASISHSTIFRLNSLLWSCFLPALVSYPESAALLLLCRMLTLVIFHIELPALLLPRFILGAGISHIKCSSLRTFK